MAPASPAPCIVWFRDDLRLSDHPALHAAADRGAPVICLYVLDETAARCPRRPLGGAARWWLAQSLRALARKPPRDRRARWCCARERRRRSSRTGARDRRRHRCSGTRSRRRRIAGRGRRGRRRRWTRSASPRKSFPGDLLAAPNLIRNKEGRGLRVFTPFWKRVQALGAPPKPLPAPKKLGPAPDVASDRSKTGVSNPPRPIGPADCARPGRPARDRRAPGSAHS